MRVVIIKNMKIRHIDHIGINVVNLKDAKKFFIDLGFIEVGEAKMQGELLDKVTGLNDARTEFVMLQAPDGQLCLEIIKYHQPVDSESTCPGGPNASGLRHIAFEVEGLDDIVKNLKQKGYNLVGSVENYKNIWKLCYVYGPEDIIIELAEHL
jgi:catechol 2,3-dioxygenase-like lactoylglutathione lyase family enzyme